MRALLRSKSPLEGNRVGFGCHDLHRSPPSGPQTCETVGRTPPRRQTPVFAACLS
jgi:hypothetical protein